VDRAAQPHLIPAWSTPATTDWRGPRQPRGQAAGVDQARVGLGASRGVSAGSSRLAAAAAQLPAEPACCGGGGAGMLAGVAAKAAGFPVQHAFLWRRRTDEATVVTHTHRLASIPCGIKAGILRLG
jgi:hypothetical protein